MNRRRLWRALGPMLLLAFGGAYALASFDWCGRWSARPPEVIARGSVQGALKVGAAKVELVPSYPVVRAGYGPPRPTATGSVAPLYARAVVLEIREVRVAIVSIDGLLIPSEVATRIDSRTRPLELLELWITATHSHSAMGGYDDRLISELAGTGRFEREARDRYVDAAAQALEEAVARLQPATLELATGALPGRIVSRDPGEPPDARLTELRLRADGKVLARLAIVAAHPTLEGRQGELLSPDYPGFLSAALEQDGGPTLVVMGSVANTSAGPDANARGFGEELARAFAALPGKEVEPKLAFARARIALPRPDARRLVPGLFRRAGDNFLCRSSARTAELAVLQLGPLRLVSAPAEITQAAGAALEQAAGAERAISLVDGYLGYLEDRGRVEAEQGESRRQYFTAELADRFVEGARAAAAALP